jgi:hypothetical protein
LYGKWEKDSFAKDPEMGIWRNEADKFAIQLSEDDLNVVVIYIKLSMVTEELLLRGFSRAMSAEDLTDEKSQGTAE